MFGFGKKKDKKKDMKKKEAKPKMPAKKDKKMVKGKQPGKKGWFLKAVIIMLLLGAFSYGLYAYIENVKAKAYVDGGNAAIDMVTQTVKENGGVEIEYNGEAIKLSAYYKPIGEDVVGGEITVVETTNSSNNSS